jgi:hypothetical protein
MLNFVGCDTPVCRSALWVCLLRLCVCACALLAPGAAALAAEPAVAWVGGDASAALLGRGTGVIVGIVDSGVSNSHPFFLGNDSLGQPRMVAQQNFVTTEGFNTGDDVFGHGTAVAGVLLGKGNVNGANYDGMAPDARFVNARVLDSNNSFSSSNPIYNGVQFALQNHSDVINMSLVVNALQSDGNTQLDLLIDYLADSRGVLVTTAAGNFGFLQAPHAIGAARNGLSVGALQTDYSRVAPFSVAGPTSDQRSKPDMVAPGSNISTADVNWQSSGSLVRSWSGTSFSAPIAAGMGAQLIDYGRANGLSTDQRVLRAVMINSAQTTLDTNGSPWSASSLLPLDNQQGSGRLDAVATAHQYMAGQYTPGAVANVGWALHDILGASTAFDTPESYTLGLPVTPGSFIDATLIWDRHVVWTDRGTPGAIDPSDSFSVNPLNPQDDLNLYLFRDGVLVASSTSAVDTVEHIHFLVDQAGSYSLRVTRGAAVDPGETYALAWRSVPEPAALTLAIIGVLSLPLLRRRLRPS